MKQPPHQMRNMLLHPPKVSKVREISGKVNKAAPKLVVNQNATKHALLADETATTSGEEHVVPPPKVSKVKEILWKDKRKLHQNRLLIRMLQKHALLANETATTSGEEHVASPPKKYQKSKKYVERAKKLH